MQNESEFFWRWWRAWAWGPARDPQGRSYVSVSFRQEREPSRVWFRVWFRVWRRAESFHSKRAVTA